MAPRKYKMKARANAVADTRRRIAEATLELHAEQGVAATSWEQIAQRAGVGVGTVYRHFRDLDELLPACGELTFEKLALPGPEIFDGARDRAERLARLTEALFALYARGAAELRNIREESELHPVLRQARTDVDRAILALVKAAVPDVPESVPLVRALTDLGTWQSLQRSGVSDPAGRIAGTLERAVADLAGRSEN